MILSDAISTDRPVRRVCRTPALRALLGLALAGGATVHAAELVVVDQAGCPYCERFEREIAPAWPNTDEGRDAPLRRVDLHGDWPADLAAVERATLTPTFILVDGGREIGRLVGYPGDEHFWFLVGDLLARLDAERSGSDVTDGMAADGTSAADGASAVDGTSAPDR